MRVSVIIRTFNRLPFLREAIASVYAQTVQDWELLVVDDGSTDRTAHELAHYDSRLKLIQLPHSGNPTRALNVGLSAARGEWIALLDDDDLWLPQKLERQLDLLEQHPGFGLAYGNVCLLDAEGHLSAPVLEPRQIVTGPLLRELVRNMCVHPSTLLFRRTLLAQVPPPDERQPVAETFLFTLQLARMTPAVCVAEPIAHLRQHARQLSTARNLANYEASVTTLEQLLVEGGISQDVRREIHHSLARYHTHLARNFVEQGRRSEARVHIRKALAENLFHRPAWRWAWHSW